MAAICHECGKNFVETQKLYLHMAIHDKTEYTCNICEKTVIGKKKLQNHMQTHETFECKKCNSTVKMNSRASHNKKCDMEVWCGITLEERVMSHLQSSFLEGKAHQE